jgi:hypothetical protein
VIYTVLFVPGRSGDPLVRLSRPQVEALEALRAVDKAGESHRVFAVLGKRTERATLGARSWIVNARAARGLVDVKFAVIDGRRARLTGDGRQARRPTSAELDEIERRDGGGT